MIRALTPTVLALSLLAPAVAAADPPLHDLTGCAQVPIETSSPLLPELFTLSFADMDLVLVPSFDAKGRVGGFAQVDGRLLALSGKVAGKGNAQKASFRAVGLVDGKPYTAFVSAGNDGTGAIRALRRIATGYPWKEIGEPLICRGELKAEDLAAAEELGMTMAAGLELGIF